MSSACKQLHLVTHSGMQTHNEKAFKVKWSAGDSCTAFALFDMGICFVVHPYAGESTGWW